MQNIMVFRTSSIEWGKSACGVVDEDGYWRILSKYIVRGDVCGGFSGDELSEHRVCVMKGFRGKAAVNADNSKLVSAKWANYDQRAVPITAVSRKRKVGETGFMHACSYKGHKDLRIGSNFSSSFKSLFSSPFSTEKSAPVIAWKVMIFISK